MVKAYPNLRAIREAYGLSQAALGAQAGISEIENGHGLPGLRLRRQITERLNAAGADVSVPEVLELCEAHQGAPTVSHGNAKQLNGSPVAKRNGRRSARRAVRA